MPELPEAETIVRALRPLVAGRVITHAEFLSARVAPHSPQLLVGRCIRDVRRQGKRVLFALDCGFLLVKLGMTGALLWNAPPGPYTRASLQFGSDRLLFDDIRQFGSLRWSAGEPAGLGPDALEISAAELLRRLRTRNSPIKVVLLDQSFLAGLGNIYADEALARAGIHPRTPARRLSPPRAARLHAAIVEVLTEAIAHGGSSVSDYVDPAGSPGTFQTLHRVYRRQGLPCPACGTLIRRIVLAQRGAHYCPVCQRR